jgi:hypothetical protein
MNVPRSISPSSVSVLAADPPHREALLADRAISRRGVIASVPGRLAELGAALRRMLPPRARTRSTTTSELASGLLRGRRDRSSTVRTSNPTSF